MRPAVREDTPLLVSLFAPPGAGKTFSALRLASGIQQVYGGDIVLIDTEAGRALHYADKFKFQHIDFAPPFGSLDYLEVIKYASRNNPAVVIVDSMSHEHIGPGGYLMEHERWVDVIAGAGADYKRRDSCSMAAWAKVAPLRTQMIQGITQIRGRFIFTYRAKEKTKPVKGSDGKISIVDMGFMPQGGDELMFEQTAACLLEPRAGGIATWKTDFPGEKLMMKLPEQFLSILNTGKPLSEEAGVFMAKWAKGATKPALPGTESASGATEPSPKGPAEPLADLPAAWDTWSTEERGENRASKGTKALKAWWETVPQGKEKTALASKLADWKLTAQTADAASS